MKCPSCWAEKAYLRKVEGFSGLLTKVFLIRPLKCSHCYHKFSVSWFKTIGKELHPPKLIRLAPGTAAARPNLAATTPHSAPSTVASAPVVARRAA